MSKILGVSINLEKIDKTKIKTDKNGKGKYYNLSVILNDQPDKYGNTVSVADSQTKEERTAKAKKNYLGNGKVVWEGSNSATSTVGDGPQDDNGGLPF